MNRPTPLPSLQAGRAAAAIAVVCYHAQLSVPRYSGPDFVWGILGVQFFFVLSGFIILHAHMEDIGRPARLGRYLWRRATRIYPIYWVVLTVVIVFGFRADLGQILLNYGLVDAFERPRIVPVAWTLFHETLFYAVFAVLIFNRWAGMAAFGVWALAALMLHRVPGAPQVITWPINLCFAFGIAARWAVGRLPPKIALWPLLLAGLGLFVLLGWTMPVGGAREVMAGSASALTITGLAMADMKGAWTVPRWLQFLGAASYSIYLTHIAIFPIAWRLLKAADIISQPPWALALLIVAATAAGSAVYLLIERPLLRLLRA